MPEQTTDNATPSPAPKEWTEGFNDDMKGFVQNKGFKGPADLLESYRNLEKLRGVPEDRLLKLPESMDSAEARAVWEKLGAPKEAKDYKFEAPTDADKTYYEQMASMFHELAVPKEMAQKILKKQAEYSDTVKTQSVEARKAALAEQEMALKKEWGMAYEQNSQLVDTAARALGLSKDEVAAMGANLGMDKAMKMLHKLGTSVGEASFIGGSAPNNGVLAPEQARNRIADLRNDSNFREKLLKGDVEAKKTWEQAHRMAYPGEFFV